MICSHHLFLISLEECTKKGSFSSDDFFWSSYVKLLTIEDDGKYTLKIEFN